MSFLEASTLKEKFPDAQFHPDCRLMTWFPQGALTNEGADQMMDFLESVEKHEGEPFHRYTDMTGYTHIEMELDHLIRLARRRRKGYRGPAVRSAFFAVRLISLSIARMYEELMCGSRIQVCTFRDQAAAATWLGVPSRILRTPNA